MLIDYGEDVISWGIKKFQRRRLEFYGLLAHIIFLGNINGFVDRSINRMRQKKIID